MFSPNMLKTFQTCPQKYWLKYIEGISVPQKASFFEKGKKIHALANYYLRGDDISKLEKTLSTEEQKLWEKLKNNEYFQMNYVNSEYNLSCKVGEYWVGGRLDAVVKNNLLSCPPHPCPPPQRGEGACHDCLSTAQSFNSSTKNPTPTPTLPLGEGDCDDSPSTHLVFNPSTYISEFPQSPQPDKNLSTFQPFNLSTDNNLPSYSQSSFSNGTQYFILDYKTGSIPKNPEYDFQTMVYLLCLYKLNRHSEAIDSENLNSAHNDSEPKNLITFVYIDLKNNQNHIINLTSEKIEEYEQAIIKICDEITNFTPQEDIKHSKKCDFCEYRKICNII